MNEPLTGAEKAWLQLDEVHEDLVMLDDEDLLACREVIQRRIEKALEYLDSYVRNDMSEYEAEEV